MATAEKTASEAKKIAGVDTKQAEANTENLIQATNNEKIRRGLILANIRYQDAMEELTRNQADAKKQMWDYTNFENYGANKRLIL